MRPLKYITSEIVRVAEWAECPPKELTRVRFLPHTDVTDYDLRRAGGYNKLRMYAQYGVSPAADLATDSAVTDRTRHARKAERIEGSQQNWEQGLTEHLQSIFEAHPPTLQAAVPLTHYLDPRHEPPERAMTLVLSDLHFGVDVLPKETLGSAYNWTIAARRLALCAHYLAHWKPHHRDRTKTIVALLGDLIEGVIHLDDINIKPAAEQVAGAVWLLAHALRYVVDVRGEVYVPCTGGNHERFPHRHKGRQTTQRWNGFAACVFTGLRAWFINDPRVTFEVSQSGSLWYDLPGDRLVYMTHGDIAPSISNPGKALPTGAIEAKLFKLDASKVLPRPVSVYMYGHWHKAAHLMVSNGAHLFINGSLIGGSLFSQNGAGEFNPEPTQLLFESTTENAVGHTLFVCPRRADDDPQWDAIVPTPPEEWLRGS